MPTIAFLIEHEEGHLNPTFKLARRLAARGHHVQYWGLADGERFVRRQGFEFLPLGADLFPRGSLMTQREQTLEEAAGHGAAPGIAALGAEHEALARCWREMVCGPSLAEAIEAARPDLFLLTSFFSQLALVLELRFGAAVGLLTPFLRPYPKRQHASQASRLVANRLPGSRELLQMAARADPSFARLGDLTERVMAMRELILCPQELELPSRCHEEEPEVHYVEPSLDLERRAEHPFPWEQVDPGRRLAYVSLGSQSYRAGADTVARFFAAVAGAFAGLPGWQLVLSTGGLVDPAQVPRPNGAIVTAWAPQLELLARAGLMITHGGLGTVKECIYHGVPMVVFPISHDQPDNARRVVHHNIGVAGDLAEASTASVSALVKAADEPEIRGRLAPFTQRFREAEAAGVAVERIEELLARGVGSSQELAAAGA